MATPEGFLEEAVQAEATSARRGLGSTVKTEETPGAYSLGCKLGGCTQDACLGRGPRKAGEPGIHTPGAMVNPPGATWRAAQPRQGG